MKLLEGTESKITKNKNSQNAPDLEITEVVLINCNVVKNNYQQKSRLLHTAYICFVRHRSVSY